MEKLLKLIVPNWHIVISVPVPLKLYGITKSKYCSSCSCSETGSCSDIEPPVTALRPRFALPCQYRLLQVLPMWLTSPSFLIRTMLKKTFSECGTTQGHIHRHARCTLKKMIILALKSVPLVLMERMWSTSVGFIVFTLQTTSSNG